MGHYTDQVLMGIDLGATGIKAAVFALDAKRPIRLLISMALYRTSNNLLIYSRQEFNHALF